MTAKRRYDMGPGGRCVCPKCEREFPHRRGLPCQEERCPKCGAKMLRVGSDHHRLLLQKKADRRPGGLEGSGGDDP